MEREMKVTINTDNAVSIGKQSLAKKQPPVPKPTPKKDK